MTRLRVFLKVFNKNFYKRKQKLGNLDPKTKVKKKNT